MKHSLRLVARSRETIYNWPNVHLNVYGCKLRYYHLIYVFKPNALATVTLVNSSHPSHSCIDCPQTDVTESMYEMAFYVFYVSHLPLTSNFLYTKDFISNLRTAWPSNVKHSLARASSSVYVRWQAVAVVCVGFGHNHKSNTPLNN